VILGPMWTRVSADRWSASRSPAPRATRAPEATSGDLVAAGSGVPQANRDTAARSSLRGRSDVVKRRHRTLGRLFVLLVICANVASDARSSGEPRDGSSSRAQSKRFASPEPGGHSSRHPGSVPEVGWLGAIHALFRSVEPPIFPMSFSRGASHLLLSLPGGARLRLASIVSSGGGSTGVENGGRETGGGLLVSAPGAPGPAEIALDLPAAAAS
jgi:hypothetical protein